ncbi:MAG: NADH-quinone oxidoreductase subunit C [Bacteroidetes bacterium]|nr:MAG: NADH-quinone oxidoreductase subunit C [Bacteroidota bacterium]
MTEDKHIKEQKIVDQLSGTFQNLTGKVKRERRVEVSVEKKLIPSVLSYVKDQLTFTHMSHMSCVDWLEDEHFELVYILWSPELKVQLLVKTLINRENPVIENVDMIWGQLNTYQREIREMYGIQFTGLVGREEFVLEDWDEMPPMRRDFDTAEYIKDVFFERPGRDGAKDVREVIATRSGEEIPELAKKYSRD